MTGISRKKFYYIYALLFCVLFFGVLASNLTRNLSVIMCQQDLDENSLRRPHTPILIQSDSDFTAANGVVSGSGTIDNPFVISGWDIEANPIYYVGNNKTGLTFPCILVKNTSAYFKIQDCKITNCISQSEIPREILGENWGGFDLVGIQVQDAVNGIITNNTIQHGSYGIVLANSNNIRVEANICYDFWWGFWIKGKWINFPTQYVFASNITVVNNTFLDCATGIFTDLIDSMELIRNSFQGSDSKYMVQDSGTSCCLPGTGILSRYSQNISISGNEFNKESEGILLDGTNYSSIMENLFVENRLGLETANCINCSIVNNTFTLNFQSISLAEFTFNTTVTENNISFYTGSMYENTSQYQYWQMIVIVEATSCNNSIFNNTFIEVDGPLNGGEIIFITLLPIIWSILIIILMLDRRRKQSISDRGIWKRRFGILLGELTVLGSLPIAYSYTLENSSVIVASFFSYGYPQPSMSTAPEYFLLTSAIPCIFIILAFLTFFFELRAYDLELKTTSRIESRWRYELAQFLSLIFLISTGIIFALISNFISAEIPASLLLLLPFWPYQIWLIKVGNQRRGLIGKHKVSFLMKKTVAVLLLEFAWMAILSIYFTCTTRNCLPPTSDVYIVIFLGLFQLFFPLAGVTLFIFWLNSHLKLPSVSKSEKGPTPGSVTEG